MLTFPLQELDGLSVINRLLPTYDSLSTIDSLLVFTGSRIFASLAVTEGLPLKSFWVFHVLIVLLGRSFLRLPP